MPRMQTTREWLENATRACCGNELVDMYARDEIARMFYGRAAWLERMARWEAKIDKIMRKG